MKTLTVINGLSASAAFVLLAVVALLTIGMLTYLVFIQQKKLIAKNLIIDEKNSLIESIGQQFSEQELVKEKYIGYFFTMISGYISRLEKIKNGVERKVVSKQYQDILLPFAQVNIKKERDELLKAFDKAFLTMFPDFVQKFNAMMRPEEQIWPQKHDSLTKELRIFALMRLGVSNQETMAAILEYTTNTIYVYKMRIKSKSVYPADEFEQKLMSIKATTIDETIPLRKSA